MMQIKIRLQIKPLSQNETAILTESLTGHVFTNNVSSTNNWSATKNKKNVNIEGRVLFFNMCIW